MNWYKLNKTSANVNALANLLQQEITNKPFQSLSPEEKQKVTNHINKRKEEIKNQIESISLNPQYQSWIYDMILAKSLIFPEDIEKTKEILEKYTKVKLSANFPQEFKDITQFKTFGELHKVVYDYSQKFSKGKKAIDLGNNKIIYNKDNIQIVELLDYNDCAYLTEETGWCIKEEEYFDEYEPPYYMFLKNDKKYALLNFESHQLKDIHDNPLENLDEEMISAILWLFKNQNIDLINNVKGDFDNALGNWCKEKLESNQAPQKWINAINLFIKINGYPPKFASDWCKEKLESGQAPQEWISAISKYIEINGTTTIFSKNWCKDKLESGQAPQEWINAITKYIEKYGHTPEFAENWCKDKLESGQAPQEWLNGISKYIEYQGHPPNFAFNWCKDKLKSDQAPQWLIDAINEYIERTGYPPGFAKHWYEKKLKKNPIPKVASKEKDGDLLEIINWYKKAQINNKGAEQKNKVQPGPIYIYRGEYSGNKGGNYYSTDKEFAKQFTQSGQEKEVIIRKIDPALIYDARNEGKTLPDANNENDFDNAMTITKELGLAGFRLTEGLDQPDSIYIINKSVLK